MGGFVKLKWRREKFELAHWTYQRRLNHVGSRHTQNLMVARHFRRVDRISSLCNVVKDFVDPGQLVTALAP